MNIKGLDYNTQRNKLLMPEYGREIQRMTQYAAGLPTKAQRNRAAKTIIEMMATKVEAPRNNKEQKQKLWDHLYVISDKQLDIDWPIDITQAEKFYQRPAPIARPKTDDRMRMRHYGRLLEQMFDQLKAMPAGKNRDKLMSHTAHQMKRVLITHGHGSHENERIADDMARYTDGKIQMDLSRFKFGRITLDEPKKAQQRNKKKKKN